LLDLIRGVLQPDDGTIELPRGCRIGFLAQEAPDGETTPLATVLAADRERTRLLAEREAQAEPLRLAEIETRLVEIKAHAAPSRAWSSAGHMPHGAAQPASWPGWGSMSGRSTSRSAVCRAAGGCVSGSPRSCLPSPICCCSTSRPTTSTSKPRCGSKAFCATTG